MSSRSSDRIPARIYPWWLLLVGFVMGVVLTFFVMYGRTPTVTVYRDVGMPENLLLEATAMVQQATMMAQSPLIATQQALQPPLPVLDDPIWATATAIIAEATAAAAQAGR